MMGLHLSGETEGQRAKRQAHGYLVEEQGSQSQKKQSGFLRASHEKGKAFVKQHPSPA